MQLQQPVTIQPPTFVRKTGETVVPRPFTVSALDLTLMDMPAQKVCMFRIARCPAPVLLWQGDEYDAAGDYTQAQAEARLLEKLGPDLKAGLERLFQR